MDKELDGTSDEAEYDVLDFGDGDVYHVRRVKPLDQVLKKEALDLSKLRVETIELPIYTEEHEHFTAQDIWSTEE